MLYNNNSENSTTKNSDNSVKNSGHINAILPYQTSQNHPIKNEPILVDENGLSFTHNGEIKLVWQVEGMDCAHCAQKIENSLKQLATTTPISHFKIIFSTEKLVVWLPKQDEKSIKLIENKIIELGYRPIFETDAVQPRLRDKRSYLPLLIFGCLIVISYLTLIFLPHFSPYAFILTAIYGLSSIAKKAYILLRSGTPFSIETLMTISAIGAIFIGAAKEACMVIFLFMIGEMLEGIATKRAKKGISSLITLMPQETTIINKGSRQTISTTRLKPGDTIEIPAGGRLPADVILISDKALIDESALTGETLPVNYLAGDKIMAGSLVVDQPIQLRVESKTGQNAIDRILKLIENAEERKAPIERFIDKFSRYYTPIIVLLALTVILFPPLLLHADWYTWIYRGLTLLLIGCPCALVISTPAVITSALSTAAKQGVLIKGGIVLENMGSIKVIAFDKTGTLTEGKPQITDILLPINSENNSHTETQESLLALAAAVEIGSQHPLAKSIIDYATAKQITFSPAENRKTLIGVGIEGEINGKTVTLISPNKLDNLQLSDADNKTITHLENEGKTVVIIKSENIFLGMIALKDCLRGDTAKAIKSIQSLGIKAIMLSGDNNRTANVIAHELNIDYRAELSPADKLNEIEKIGSTSAIAMVGDGINDSPALKCATVGIAMGNSSDVALESADAALTKNSLLTLPFLIRLARFANQNIRQNITIALGIKAIFLITSIFGATGLWMAVLADSGTTAIVTANALRLLKFRGDKNVK